MLKKNESDLAGYYGEPASADKKMSLMEWTTDRIGVPLLCEALAWFECQVVGEHPAGDHLLVLGKVINGKLLDSEAEPMTYRQTGAMDGAAELFPDVFNNSLCCFRNMDGLWRSVTRKQRVLGLVSGTNSDINPDPFMSQNDPKWT